MKGLNVLLTGACGRIGKVFFQGSQERHRFTLTDRVEPDFEIPAPHRFVRLYFDDPHAIGRLLPEIDVIVHLAGIPNATASFDGLLANNILATT